MKETKQTKPKELEPKKDESKSNNQKRIIGIAVVLGVFSVFVCLVPVTILFVINNQPEQPPINTGSGANIPTDTRGPEVIETDKATWFLDIEEVEEVTYFDILDENYSYGLEYCPSTDPNFCSDPISYQQSFSIWEDTYADKVTYYYVGDAKGEYEGEIFLGIVNDIAYDDVIKGWGTEKDIVNERDMLALFIRHGDNTYTVPNNFHNRIMLCDNVKNFQYCPDDTSIENKAGIIFIEDFQLIETENFFEYMHEAGKTQLSVFNTYELFQLGELEMIYQLNDGSRVYRDKKIDPNDFDIVSTLNFYDPRGEESSVGTPHGSKNRYTVRNATGLEQMMSIPDGYYLGDVTEYIDPDFQLEWIGEEPSIIDFTNDYYSPGTDVNRVQYSSDYGGCRQDFTFENFSGVDMNLDLDEDFSLVANGQNGEKFYAFNSKDNELHTLVYDFFVKDKTYYISPISYSQFLELEPLIIYENFMGDLTLLFRRDIVLSQCWAEPVIYIYPEETTDFKVELDSVDFFKTDPFYNNGWEITAHPNGLLIDKNTDRAYKYLFWEGDAQLYGDPAVANVVSQEDTPSYIRNSLKKLGLNDSEIRDFTDYWVPKMNWSDYYLIKFYDKNTIDNFVPLSVSPSPDTTIRVMMDFVPLSEDKAFNEIGRYYKTPQRIGTTVVEWGGIAKHDEHLR